MEVPTRPGESVGLAHRGHSDDVNPEALAHEADDRELLSILLAEYRHLGRHDLEQSEHDGGDTGEVSGSMLTFETFGDRPRIDGRHRTLGVDLGDTRREHGVDALGDAGCQVGREISWVGIEVGGPIELGRVHEDRYHHPVGSPVCLAYEFDVSLMEGSHRWNHGDGVSLGDPRPR